MSQYEEISIDQGADVIIEIGVFNADGSPKELYGYSVNSVMKKTVLTSDSDSIPFTAFVIDPASDGKIALMLTNQQTKLLTSPRYVYDVKLLHMNTNMETRIETILNGIISVNPSITGV